MFYVHEFIIYITTPGVVVFGDTKTAMYVTRRPGDLSLQYYI